MSLSWGVLNTGTGGGADSSKTEREAGGREESWSMMLSPDMSTVGKRVAGVAAGKAAPDSMADGSLYDRRLLSLTSTGTNDDCMRLLSNANSPSLDPVVASVVVAKLEPAVNVVPVDKRRSFIHY